MLRQAFGNFLSSHGDVLRGSSRVPTHERLGQERVTNPQERLLGRLVTLQITQGPEETCLSLENQNPSKTSEKMGYFERVTVSLHIL